MGEDDVTLQRAMLGEYYQAMGHADEFIVDMLMTSRSQAPVQQGPHGSTRVGGDAGRTEKHFEEQQMAQEIEQSKKLSGVWQTHVGQRVCRYHHTRHGQARLL